MAEEAGAQESSWPSCKLVDLSTDVLDSLSMSCSIDPTRLRWKGGLGEGAFAKVRAAELNAPCDSSCTGSGGGGSTGQQQRSFNVAMKLLGPELLEDPDQVRQFIQEIEVLRSLCHRHIVSFIGYSWQLSACLEDSARDDGGTPAVIPTPTEAKRAPVQCYFVQEYCSGGSLGELVQQQLIRPYKPLYSDADTLHWSLHIAWALQYLHEPHPAIMHRDLKLDNVMLSSANLVTADAKLADFGLARHSPAFDKVPTAAAAPGAAHTSINSVRSKKMSFKGPAFKRGSMAVSDNIIDAATSAAELTGRTGSFGYMALDALASRPYNASADIFSLGMCIFDNVMTGSLTGADSHMEVFAGKVAEGYRPPLPPHLSPDVAQVIEACWKGDPSLRPSARSVAQMLERVQESGTMGGSAFDTASQGCSCAIM